MLCSLCFYECNESSSISLFGEQGETSYWKKITKHMQLELPCGDDNDIKVVCKDCANHLDDFSNFCQYVEERQKLLMVNTFANAEIPIDISIIKEFYTAESNSVIEEAAIYSNKSIASPKDVSETNENLPSETDAFASKYQKAGSPDDASDAQNNSEDGDIEENPIKEDCEAQELAEDDIPLNDLFPKKKASPLLKAKSKPVAKKKQLGKARRKAATSMKFNEGKKSKASDTKEKEANIEGEMHEKIIKKNIAIRCEICDCLEDSFMKLQAHYRLKHGCKGYLKCCGKIFAKRHRLADHIKLHLDPEAFQCHICKKSLHSKYYLRRHIEDRHSNLEEKKLQCPFCERKFANKTTFQVHCKSHSRTQIFSCDRCDKTFKHKTSLEVHIKHIHEEQNNPFVCDICGRGYRFKPSFDAHVAEHKGIVLNVPKRCEICGEAYTRYDRHMDKHNHEDVTCGLCGKVSTSKAGLRGHMEKKHSKSTKQPKIYSCTFCEKTFTRQKSFKEHVTIHTDEKLYRCKYCQREFRSNANMYTHIKRSHAVQWLEAKQAAAAKKRLPQAKIAETLGVDSQVLTESNFENT